jgi:hypothetical protein
MLTLLAGWTGATTASAAPSAARFGPSAVAGHGTVQPGTARPSGVRSGAVRAGERATGGQVAAERSAAVGQPDRKLPGPLPALPVTGFVLVPQVAAGGRSPNGPPPAVVPLAPSTVRGRAPPLLVSPAPDQ